MLQFIGEYIDGILHSHRRENIKFNTVCVILNSKNSAVYFAVKLPCMDYTPRLWAVEAVALTGHY
jgi:hypothetical protein